MLRLEIAVQEISAIAGEESSCWQKSERRMTTSYAGQNFRIIVVEEKNSLAITAKLAEAAIKNLDSSAAIILMTMP